MACEAEVPASLSLGDYVAQYPAPSRSLVECLASETCLDSTCEQPDANPVMHQHVHTSGAAVREQINAVRLRHAEHRNHPGQRSFSADTHTGMSLTRSVPC